MRQILSCSVLLLPLFALSCASVPPTEEKRSCADNDLDCDGMPNYKGEALMDDQGNWLQHDFDNDGVGDGFAVDTNGDGYPDGVAVDVDGDGFFDEVDLDGDGVADTGDSACAGSGDTDCDGVPDVLGVPVVDATGTWLQHDFNNDGVGDGLSVDINRDGLSDGIVIDTDGDGVVDAVDLNGDMIPDDVSGSGGGSMGTGGAPVSTGAGGTVVGTGGGTTTAGGCVLGEGKQSNGSTTQAQYIDIDVQRDGKNYMMISNGWGANWDSHTLSWMGTSLTVDQFQGSKQSNGAPAGYPTVFCGKYSDKQSLDCGLPADLSSLSSLNTGLSWSHPGGEGTYNVAYDVWMGNGGNLTSYFMVWFKNPAGESPAGQKTTDFITVDGVDGPWDIYTGQVNGLPIVNYVRPNGQESYSLAFDMMDFINDAKTRGLNFPGSQVLSVAVGFEIWQGPVSGLKIEDFCLDVQ